MGAPGSRDNMMLVVMLTKATSYAREQLFQNARLQQMLETALILAFERKRRGVQGSSLEPWLSRKAGVAAVVSSHSALGLLPKCSCPDCIYDCFKKE